MWHDFPFQDNVNNHCSFMRIMQKDSVVPFSIYMRDINIRTRDRLIDFFSINSLPKDKILDWSKQKAFADDKIKVL